MSKNNTSRPVFLNLFQLHFPLNAILSIGHRITGFFLAMSLPVVFLTVAYMSQSQTQFDIVAHLLGCCWVSRALCGLFIAIYSYHVLAGCRHLIMDCGIGLSPKKAKFSAWSLIVIYFLVIFQVGGKIWG